MGRLADLVPGQELEPIVQSISAAANERYWRAAGADHALLRAGALYPPIAGNLTILLLQRTVPEQVLHVDQEVRSHRRGHAGEALEVRGRVASRFARRGREYATVEATIGGDAGILWSAAATFAELRPRRTT